MAIILVLFVIAIAIWLIVMISLGECRADAALRSVVPDAQQVRDYEGDE